jgi:hypothetical protein
VYRNFVKRVLSYASARNIEMKKALANTGSFLVLLMLAPVVSIPLSV